MTKKKEKDVVVLNKEEKVVEATKVLRGFRKIVDGKTYTVKAANLKEANELLNKLINQANDG